MGLNFGYQPIRSSNLKALTHSYWALKPIIIQTDRIVSFQFVLISKYEPFFFVFALWILNNSNRNSQKL
ncbi:hypothetical protein Csa_013254 [Cucumis sativus]|uniref:Uncharacterized protein n=1 Tax=Cucumis sativus TaxID=3659 RepID=A0A0A0LU73_CUCSA|nr:hypothetical protein Csa_013254 [Cucumis sativus]